ncbi:hypothetical protein HZC33_01800 [Candidatus Wolfebacteria bacterium]|nr:hypothetical protein [Candidatus Wolfebacteria bacterium]
MNIQSILNILNPQPNVGALEISDVDLKFAQIKNNHLQTHSVKLAEGVVKEGKINDQKGFLEALNNLRSQITDDKKKEIYAIINIPDNNIYLQTLNLPAIAEAELDEAAKLNLRMVSPIDFEKTYADWQLINKSQTIERANQLEILGAFVQSQIIDDIDNSLKQAGFIPTAIEFNSLSLSRLAINLGAEIDAQKPFILIYFGNNGLSFNLIRNGNLYFNHFVSWQLASAETSQIPVETFKKLIIDELKKVLSFYTTRSQEPINEIVLAAYGLEENISKIISENFSFKVRPLTLKKIQGIPASWFPAIGSATRAETPWSKDFEISLGKIGTEEKLFQYKSIKFVEIWRDAALISLALVLIIFIGADVFLKKTFDNLEYQFTNMAKNSAEEQEEKNLIKEISSINKQIELANKALEKRTIISSLLEKIKTLSSDNKISFRRIFVQSWTAPIFINAFANDSEAALNFRDKLITDGGFENVDLPITKISPSEGGVNFTISFKIKK